MTRSSPGAEALACLEAAGLAALASKIDGIVTGPVNKFAIGPTFHGQTDFLAAQAGRQRFAMAFFGFRHEYGVGALFVIAVCLMGGSLTRFAQEVRIALHEFENYR